MKINPREKRRHAEGREKNEAPRRVSPFLAWGDFHARSRFARSSILEEKWETTRSLPLLLSEVQLKRKSSYDHVPPPQLKLALDNFPLDNVILNTPLFAYLK